jgi:DNA transformation protein
MPRKPARPRRFGPPDILAAKPRDSMSEWLEDCLSRLPDLEIRRMFSGAGIYSEQTMFGILAAGRVYLKIDDATRGAFEERGMGPFQTRRGLALRSYYEVPPDVLDDEAALLEWSRRAVAAARNAPSRAARKRKAPGKRR